MKTSGLLFLLASCLLICVNAFGQTDINELNVAYKQSFDAMGSSATSAFPGSFRGYSNVITPTWSVSSTLVAYSAGISGANALNASSPGGFYNLANGVNGSTADRILGILSDGTFGTPNNGDYVSHILAAYTNNSGETVTS